MADLASQYMISNPEDCQSISTSVATRIETGSLKFANFISYLGEYIADEDLIIQAKSIECIAGVLASFKPDFLPRVDNTQLFIFLGTRIRDNAGVKEAAQGLRSLMEMTRFNKDNTPDIMETLFKNATILQRQPALSRFAIYRLIETSLERCREILQGMDGPFVDGLLSLVEFEKDPRNLMIVFSSLRVVMAEFAVSEGHTVALWDAVFRYYPISYNPKPEDKVQVTKQDLQQRLEACITSNSRFAPYAFPSLLAKLDQEIGVTVKIETLKTISACIMAYSPTAVLPYLGGCWDLIKYEAYSEMDSNAALQGASALSSIVEKAFEPEEDGAEQRKLVQRATKEILDNMEKPTKESSRKAMLIVSAVAGGSALAFSRLLRSIMPALLTIYQDLDGNLSATTALLKLFNRILDDTNSNKASTFYTPPSIAEIQPQKLRCIGTLENFREELLELYDIALRQQETSIRVTALQGLVKLAQIPCFLSADEISMILQSLIAIVLAPEHEDELHVETVSGLQLLSAISEDQIRDNVTSAEGQNMTNTCRDGAGMMENTVFPTLLAAAPLPPNTNGKYTTGQEATDLYGKIAEIYDVLAAISPEVKVFDAFLRTMKEKLEQALKSSTIEMVMIILFTTASGLQQHTAHFRKFSGGLKYPLDKSPIKYDQFVKELFSLAVAFDEHSFSITTRIYPNITLDDHFLDWVGRIAMMVFRSVRSYQESAAAEIFTLFVTNSDAKTSKAIENKLQGWHSHNEASQDQRRTVILSKYLLASLRPDPELLMAYDLRRIAANVLREIECNGEADSWLVVSSFQEILGVLVNKFDVKSLASNSVDEEPLDMAIRALLATCLNDQRPVSIAQAIPVVMLAFGYATAMVKKGDDMIYTSTPGTNIPFLEYLITLLGGEKGELVAAGFEHLLEKSNILNKKSHAVIAANHKKKLYDHFFPALVKSFESSKDPIAQKNCLIALTKVIGHISEEQFVLQSNPIAFMLRALDLETIQPSCKRAALEVVGSTIQNNPEALSAHHNSVVNRLMACMKDSDPLIRAMALACTGCIPSALKAKSFLLANYRRKVLRALDSAMADPVAEVRTEAVDCRMKWFSIDDPSEE